MVPDIDVYICVYNDWNSNCTSKSVLLYVNYTSNLKEKKRKVKETTNVEKQNIREEGEKQSEWQKPGKQIMSLCNAIYIKLRTGH